MMPSLSEVILTVGKHAISSRLHEPFLMDARNIEFYVDRHVGDMAMRLVAKIAQKKADVIVYPADWKEAFKERWFPSWLLEKFPVKYVRVDVMEYYPKVALPDREPVVKFVKQVGGW
jgi:hypothetical protein